MSEIILPLVISLPIWFYFQYLFIYWQRPNKHNWFCLDSKRIILFYLNSITLISMLVKDVLVRHARKQGKRHNLHVIKESWIYLKFWNQSARKRMLDKTSNSASLQFNTTQNTYIKSINIKRRHTRSGITYKRYNAYRLQVCCSKISFRYSHKLSTCS